MKLVIFGLTLSSSWGNGHATLWRGLCRALAERGHRIVFFEADREYYATHRDLTELECGQLVIYRAWSEVRARAWQELADADVGIVTSYCSDAIAATELLNDCVGKLKVFYDLDTPVTLSAVEEGRPVDYIGERGLRDFDLVLSYTGGRALDELRSRLGARRVATLYGSVDPSVHRRVGLEQRFRADLSYLGTYAPDRQSTLETLFMEPARRLPQRRFLIGGAQYPQEFPWAENIFFVQHVDPAYHPAFYSSSRLTLNVTRRAMKAMGYCPSGRLFEAAACGTPILSDGWEGLDRFFTPGEEIIVAQTSDEATAAMEFSDAELQRIARRALERVHDEHTARHRVIELEKLLGETLCTLPTEASTAVAIQHAEI
ncbi:MAG: glycosyltransferase [Opitutus sp.]|nr:glycosyltransferase [Opitutus sp.]